MLDYTQIEALLAVKREGSFEKAGKALGITPIAIARRVDKLGVTLGANLLNRKPTRPTEAGEALCRYAEQIEAAEQRLLDEQRALGRQSANPIVSNSSLNIAISEENLTGWFQHVLKDHLQSNEQPLLDIAVIDADHSIELMKSGDVIAALSGARQPVNGFKAHHLGCVAHRAVASPDFFKRHFKDGVTAQSVSVAPSLRYDNQDGLVLQWLDQVFKTTAHAATMRLPCRNEIIESCLRGTAWSVLPDLDLKHHLEDGSLIELVPETSVQRELYWHVSSAMVEPLAHITASIRKAAQSHI